MVALSPSFDPDPFKTKNEPEDAKKRERLLDCTSHTGNRCSYLTFIFQLIPQILSSLFRHTLSAGVYLSQYLDYSRQYDHIEDHPMGDPLEVHY